MINHKLLITAVSASIGLVALLGAATNAFGAGPRKPVLCTEFEIIRAPHRVVAMCTDSKRPRFLVRFAEVRIPVAENDTDERRVLVGYTSVDQ